VKGARGRQSSGLNAEFAERLRVLPNSELRAKRRATGWMCGSSSIGATKPSVSLRAQRLRCDAPWTVVVPAFRLISEDPAERDLEFRISEVIPERLRARGNHALSRHDVPPELSQREFQRKGRGGNNGGSP
jgi:hypothetical protein